MRMLNDMINMLPQNSSDLNSCVHCMHALYQLTCLMDVALSVSVQSHYSLLAIVYSYRDVQSLHYSYIID